MGRVCFITGVAGFIGSRLAAALLEEGHDVRGLDSFDDHYDPRQKAWNLEALEGDGRFRWVRGDILEEDLRPLLDGVDVVFHLAAKPGVRSSWGRSFAQYDRQNVLATQRLLEVCVEAGVGRVVYASSSSVYGEMPGRPAREDDPKRPISPYGVTKLAAEHLVQAYHASHGLAGVSLRYFTVYGPGQRPDMAFHRFLRGIYGDEVLTLFGDGSQTRDVTYVGDVVAATMRAMTSGVPGEAYNVGGGRRVRLDDVLALMESVTGRRARIRRDPRPPGDPVHTGADIRRARDELGFDPRTTLESGIQAMAVWMAACLERGI